MTDYSVLLVEDDPFNRDILREILDEIDCCAVVEKRNGAEALAWLNANPAPHVILLDMMMPEMDGYQLLDHLRAAGRLDGIRVIGISARAHTHDQEKALSAGCWRYLTKPFNINEVEQAVRDALGA